MRDILLKLSFYVCEYLLSTCPFQKLRNVIQARHVYTDLSFSSFSKMPQVGTLTRAITPIGNSMQICLPIYHPHLSSGIFVLFPVVFVVCACPNVNWIRFHFLSQHHIYKFVSYFCPCLFRSDQLSLSF